MDPTTDAVWLSATDLQALRYLGARRNLTAGSTLFTEGDEPFDVAIVEEGDIKLVTVAVNGQEIVLDVAGPGEVIGELSALDGAPRSATAVALTHCTLTSVPVDRFTRYLSEHPASMGALLTVVVGRLRQSNRRQLEFSTADALGRVSARLDQLAGRYGVPDGAGAVTIDLPINQSELAQWCGLSREAVVKALRKLRNLGWVATTDGRLIVLDRPQLHRRGQM